MRKLKKRYAVGKVGSKKVFWFTTLAEAQAKIESFVKKDPAGLIRGDYYLDGPDR